MSRQYHVKLEKERLVFSAAHFITYADDICEPLHGHNYHVSAEIHGELDDNQYVIDFIALRDTLQTIVDELDHRMLLPTGHPTIRVDSSDNEVEVTHGERRWVFPAADCTVLPIANTTAELLAKYIGNQLLDRLEQRYQMRPADVRIGVDECDGQWAFCHLTDE
ncbi:MAG: 6-pyruvoyl tetrahydropterin synthase family protein [Planctomycetota bacterium]